MSLSLAVNRPENFGFAHLPFDGARASALARRTNRAFTYLRHIGKLRCRLGPRASRKDVRSRSA